MPETVTESLICNVCDTEIRDGSVFCYNCGETVSDTQIEEDIVPEINDVPVSDSELKEAAIDNDMRAAFEEADEIERDTEELSVKAKPDKLRSAASLRKRARAYKRRPAEFVWDKRSGPSQAFIVVTLVLTIFTGVLLFLAFILK